MKLKPLQRQVEIRADMLDYAARTITFPFSSEAPVDRWFGTEILDHSEKSVRMDRINSGAPLLFNHGANDVIGVVEKAALGSDKRGYATVRFAKTDRADEVLGMVNDNVLRNVSFMYRIHDLAENDKTKTYRATDWEPMEVSIVTVPADYSVGIGRAQGTEESEVRITRASSTAVAAESKGVVMTTATEAAAGQGSAGTEDAVKTTEQRGTVEVMNQEISKRINRSHTSSLIALGEKYNIELSVVRKWVEAEMSIDAAGEETTRIMEERKKVGLTNPATLGLSSREASNFSLMRAVRAVVDKNWTKAGFEAECSRQIASKLGRQPDEHKFYIPVEVQERPIDMLGARNLANALNAPFMGQVGQPFLRDLTVATTTAGGFLVETVNVGFIEMLRNRSVCFMMGARRLSGLVGNVSVPKQTGAATAVWLANEASTITESQQVFAQMLLSPKNVGAYTEISRQLMLQSSPAAESIVMADLAAVTALAVDLAGLEGTGSGGQPTGISLTAGIGAFTGTTLGYTGVIDAQADVASANIMPVSPGYVTTPAVAALLMGRSRFANTDTPVWDGNIWNGVVGGMPARSSNQLTAATAVFGDWDKMVIAEWGVLEVEVNPYANFQAGIIGVRAMYSVDVGIRYPAAFSRSTTIT